MLALDRTLDMLRRLEEGDRLLQARFEQLITRYFAFLKSHRCVRWLRMRRERSSDAPGGRRTGRISRVSWTERVRNLRTWGCKGFTRRLPEPFDPGWIFTIAKDLPHRPTYLAFDRERRELNDFSKDLVQARARLRLALVNRWCAQCAPDHLRRAAELVRQEPTLTSRDVSPVASAIAMDRALTRLEVQLDEVCKEYRRAVRDRAERLFEPSLKRRREGRGALLDAAPAVPDTGHMRLVWGYRKTIEAADDARQITDEVPWPTDRRMRAQRIPARVRRLVGGFTRRLVPLMAAYQRHIAWLGQHRERVGKLVARPRGIEMPDVGRGACDAMPAS